MLEWLRPPLAAAGYPSTEPDPRTGVGTWTSRAPAVPYLVGASGDAEAEAREIDWVVQIEKHRSMTDRMFGRNAMADDDPVSAAIEKIVRADSQIQSVNVESER